MNDGLKPYRITAYTEWDRLEVEAACADDEHAMEKARRYCSLKHVGTNFPSYIFSYVVAVEPTGAREVGTWEYCLKGSSKPAFFWHAGDWSERPLPMDQQGLRDWATKA